MGREDPHPRGPAATLRGGRRAEVFFSGGGVPTGALFSTEISRNRKCREVSVFQSNFEKNGARVMAKSSFAAPFAAALAFAADASGSEHNPAV